MANKELRAVPRGVSVSYQRHRHSHSPISWRHMYCSGLCCGWRTWGNAAWLLVMCLLTRPVLPEVIYRVDPLALLAATLRTYQRAGCDSEQLSLSCPRGTSISIELAQFGRAGDLSDHSLCPPVSQEDLTTTGSARDAVIHSGTEIEVKPPESCTVSGLQYALLQAVVDACQKKRHCKFAANSKTHSSGDPCFGMRKFVEIAYKCRPYEFRSKVACENDNMPLVCNPYSRIAIYSASFGHTERESVQCGGGGSGSGSSSSSSSSSTIDRDNSNPTCLVSYATETVMQICHGRRRCSVTADAGTFGRPCKADVRMYLKVVYTCIPRKVLKDRYETAPESDEPQQTELDLNQDELYDEDQFYKESEAIPPAPKLQGAYPNGGISFEHGSGSEGNNAMTTMLPPLVSSNDDSLQARLQSSVQLLNRIKASLNQYPANEAGIVIASPPVTNAVKDDMDTESKAMGINVDAGTEANQVTTTVSDEVEMKMEVELEQASPRPVLASTGGNYFYRRRCQMVDDWGAIGLNCTKEDTITERVEVDGFLVNWLQTYLHIRKHQELFYLYLIISVGAGVLLCLTLVLGRLALQRRLGVRKNSTSSACNGDKAIGDLAVGGGGPSGGSKKYQHNTTGETDLPDSLADDISDIDADVDMASPMPITNLSPRNETYMTYTPMPNCTYDGVKSGSPYPTTSVSPSILMATQPTSHQGGQLLLGPSKPLLGVGSSGHHQYTSPPATIYTSMGNPVVSGALTMGPHMLGPSSLGNMPPSTSYLGGTLRRTLIPTSMGLVSANLPPHSLAAVTSNSGIYYESTVPRSLARGASADTSSQYYYG